MEKVKIKAKKKDLQKDSWEFIVETLMTLRKENQQLKNRIHQLEIWLEEAIASLTSVL